MEMISLTVPCRGQNSV